MKIERVTVSISGLTCGGGGALPLERAFVRITGVVRAYVNPATEMAYVEYDADRVSPPMLVATAERLGFRVGKPSLR